MSLSLRDSNVKIEREKRERKSWGFYRFRPKALFSVRFPTTAADATRTQKWKKRTHNFFFFFFFHLKICVIDFRNKKQKERSCCLSYSWHVLIRRGATTFSFLGSIDDTRRNDSVSPTVTSRVASTPIHTHTPACVCVCTMQSTLEYFILLIFSGVRTGSAGSFHFVNCYRHRREETRRENNNKKKQQQKTKGRNNLDDDDDDAGSWER